MIYSEWYNQQWQQVKTEEKMIGYKSGNAQVNEAFEMNTDQRGIWRKKSQHQLILIHGYTSIMAGAMNIEQVMQTKTINNDKAQICCLFVASTP